MDPNIWTVCRRENLLRVWVGVVDRSAICLLMQAIKKKVKFSRYGHKSALGDPVG